MLSPPGGRTTKRAGLDLIMTVAAQPNFAGIYRDKPESYFANARNDIVERLSIGPQNAILELGCGAGGTGRVALAAGKAGRYVGIELNAGAAETARRHLTEVLVGNVEAMDLAPLANTFDALIISEVLEHLVDPWGALERLALCLKPGGAVYASSPNVAHWSVIGSLFAGRFDYDDKGVMDRTHLRWFTPRSYRAMFEAAGLEVTSVEPATPLRWKARLLDRITRGRLRHLFHTQILLIGRRPTASSD